MPPFAIARLGSADEPMDNYTIELDAPDNQDQPLGYRALKPLPTLIVGERSGEIEEVRTPQLPLQFKVHGKNGEQIRPVAPFLEVFAVVETGKKEDELVPLTVELLRENGLSVKDVSWTVSVANRKVARRTGDDNDVVKTDKVIVGDHDIHTLHGHCNNFESTHDNSIEFGQVRFIKPNAKHPEIRLRFTPARGLIYGPKLKAGQPFPGSADGSRRKLRGRRRAAVCDPSEPRCLRPGQGNLGGLSGHIGPFGAGRPGPPGAEGVEKETQRNLGPRQMGSDIRQRNVAARSFCDQSAGALVALRQCRDQSWLS